MAVTIPTVPEYTGNVPLIGQGEEEFSANAQSSLQFQAQLPVNINAAISPLNSAINEIKSDAEDASASASAALAAANYIGEWATLSGAKSAGVVVSHDGYLWMLKVATSDIALIEPLDTDATNWQPLNRWSGVNNADLYSVARAVNTSSDNVAQLSVSETYTGQQFFYSRSDELSYFIESGLTGQPSSISSPTDGIITVTISSVDYEIEDIRYAVRVL